jgi:hypothetical protein
MKTSMIAAGVALLLSGAVTLAQPYGPGPGPGSGPGAQAPGPGYGPGRGPGAGPGSGPRGPRAPRFGSSNTPGWSMMTRDERNTYRQQMLSAKSVEDCQAALADHRKLMEERARQRGGAGPRGPRNDMCQIMQQRGFFK